MPVNRRNNNIITFTTRRQIVRARETAGPQKPFVRLRRAEICGECRRRRTGGRWRRLQGVFPLDLFKPGRVEGTVGGTGLQGSDP